jgi:hypothetical protein
MSDQRLISLCEARKYLRGRHPSKLGIQPVDGARRRGQRYDRVAIDRKLDELGGIPGVPVGAQSAPASSGVEAELDRLWQKLEAPRHA